MVDTRSTPVDYIPLDHAIQPYKFKQGTYWVYANDSTGILDSIVVDSTASLYIRKAAATYNVHDTKNEYYKMYMHDVSSSVYYWQTLVFGNEMIRNFSGNEYLTGFSSPDFTSFYGQIAYQSNSPAGTSKDGMTILAKNLSMSVNSTSFNDIDEIKITAADQHQHEFAYDTYLYYTDTVGLVKKESFITPTNIESWSIKRWHIIR